MERNGRKPSITRRLLSTFVLGTIGVVFILVALWIDFGWKQLQETIRLDFVKNARIVSTKLERIDDEIRKTLEILALTPLPERNATRESLGHYAAILRLYPRIYAIYRGEANGDFFELINLQSAPEIRRIYRAPAGARWIHIRIFGSGGKRVRRMVFLDDSFHILETREEPSTYHATVRPWYRLAEQLRGVVKTPVYVFSNLRRKGITYARKAPDRIIAMDYTVENLGRILDSLRIREGMKLWLLDSRGRVVASSEANRSSRVPAPIVQALQKRQTGRIFEFSDPETDRTTEAMLLPVSHVGGEKTWLAFSIDKYRLIRPYLGHFFFSLAVAVTLIALYLQWIRRVVRPMVEPIDRLMEENQKVQRHCYDEVEKVESEFEEFDRLSESIVSMSRSICNFQRSQKELIRAFIQMLARAVDAKSYHTGKHAQRVPEIALALLREAESCREGKLAAFAFEDPRQREEFEWGAWLHDCGKITTPDYVIEKATRLETIHDRIHEVRTRFEVLWRDAEIERLEAELAGEDPIKARERMEATHRRLREEFAFVAQVNRSEIPMDQAAKRRLETIASRRWIRHFDKTLGVADAERERMGPDASKLFASEPLLGDMPEHRIKRSGFDLEEYRRRGFVLPVPPLLYDRGELHNLTVERGNLTPEERFKIQEHVMMTIEMLEDLPWPEGMKRIAEYAGTHHEHLDGKGYPRGLSGEELSIPARIMAIADVFEALTASERPYKRPFTLSKTLEELARMVRDGQIDRDLFVLFVRKKVYREYAERYLQEWQKDYEQIDEEKLMSLSDS